MTQWLFLALFGHLANAVAFVIDKALLTTTWKQSATYAALISGFSVITLVASHWVKQWPSASAWFFIVPFGACFVFGLWGFFEALKRAAATRIVPMVGSLVPLFTIAGTSLFLGERLTLSQWIGFVSLLLAILLLTWGKSRFGKLTPVTVLLAIGAALLFAMASVFGKFAFERGEFLAIFITSRFVAAVTGALIGVLSSGARQELMTLFRPAKDQPKVSRKTVAFTIVGQLFGAIGFICIYLSIAQGSAAIVNALQAVQYAAIALVAWFGGSWLRRVLHEDRSLSVIVVKSVALILVAVGLGLISFNL